MTASIGGSREALGAIAESLDLTAGSAMASTGEGYTGLNGEYGDMRDDLVRLQAQAKGSIDNPGQTIVGAGNEAAGKLSGYATEVGEIANRTGNAELAAVPGQLNALAGAADTAEAVNGISALIEKYAGHIALAAEKLRVIAAVTGQEATGSSGRQKQVTTAAKDARDIAGQM